jgi:hypothetical protein
MEGFIYAMCIQRSGVGGVVTFVSVRVQRILHVSERGAREADGVSDRTVAPKREPFLRFFGRADGGPSEHHPRSVACRISEKCQCIRAVAGIHIHPHPNPCIGTQDEIDVPL